MTHYRHHGWATPWWLKILQELRIVLHPDYHVMHHKNISVRFGLYNGWGDLILDPIMSFLHPSRYFPHCETHPHPMKKVVEYTEFQQSQPLFDVLHFFESSNLF